MGLNAQLNGTMVQGKQRGGMCFLLIPTWNYQKKIVEACIEKSKDKDSVAIIILEESFGIGFKAQCKKLEKSFYSGVNALEAPRFFGKKTFEEAGGYDEEMISGEDWDLSSRVGARGSIGRINAIIRHNEGNLSLRKTLKKKYYYAKKSRIYLEKTLLILSS